MTQAECFLNQLAVVYPDTRAGNAECTFTQSPPEVTIADANHLLVNWAKSFEGCDNGEVLEAQLHVRDSDNMGVNFADKEVKVLTSPCLKLLDIRVVVKLRNEDFLWTHLTQYNAYSEIEKLYSGLLGKRMMDKICDKNVNVFPMSDIPDEVKHCVENPKILRGIEQGINFVQFSFTIIDPAKRGGRKVVKSRYKTEEYCRNQSTEESGVTPTFCRSNKEPHITVVTATHLYVSWENSFIDCADKIIATYVHLDDSQPLQLPPSETKAAYIEADPCLEHRISVIIELKQASGSEGGLSSPDSLYNTDLKIERIYSGLLGGKFSEQLCAKSNKSNTTELMIPEIPVALKHCVKVNLNSEDPSQFDISIVDPRGGQGRSDIKVHCKNPTVLNEAMQPHTNNFDEWVLPTIIGTTLLVIVLIVVVIS